MRYNDSICYRWCYAIAFAMDKKIDKSKLVDFLAMGYEKDIFVLLCGGIRTHVVLIYVFELNILEFVIE